MPAGCIAERDAVIRSRVRALAPVLAAATLAWIALDAMALTLADAGSLALLRIVIAAALVVLSRHVHRLTGIGALRAFVWLQAFGYGGLQLLFVHVRDAGFGIGYGLFPFIVAAQIALFPVSWWHGLRTAIAPAALLAVAMASRPHAMDAQAWDDIWLLVLLAAVAVWTAQAQLVLLVKLLGARRDAALDALTGLANRRMADARLAAELARCARHGDALTVLMLDLDHFKQVNDRHGHAAGDLVLEAASGALAAELRASDLGARYGGEEFLALLPETSLDEAMRVAERIRVRIAALCVDTGTVVLRVTVSIGVAQLRRGEDADALLARADAALYLAKSGGRDRCEASADTDPTRA